MSAVIIYLAVGVILAIKARVYPPNSYEWTMIVAGSICCVVCSGISFYRSWNKNDL